MTVKGSIRGSIVVEGSWHTGRGRRCRFWLRKRRLTGAEPWRISGILTKKEGDVGTELSRKAWVMADTGHWRWPTWYESQLHPLPTVWPLEYTHALVSSSINAGDNNKTSNGLWEFNERMPWKVFSSMLLNEYELLLFQLQARKGTSCCGFFCYIM